MAKVLKGLKAVSLADVLKEIKRALDEASKEPDLHINKMTIILSVDQKGSAGIGGTIPIVGITGKIEGKVNRLTKTTIVFEPRPPAPVNKSNFIEETIPKSIQTIIDAIVAAKNIAPDLQFESAQTEIDFTIGENGSLNFIFTGSEEVNATHKIIIDFKNPDSSKAKI